MKLVEWPELGKPESDAIASDADTTDEDFQGWYPESISMSLGL